MMSKAIETLAPTVCGFVEQERSASVPTSGHLSNRSEPWLEGYMYVAHF